MQGITMSTVAGALDKTPIARGLFKGRCVLIKVMSEAGGVAGHPPLPKIDPARAQEILATGSMHQVRQTPEGFPTWIRRSTTFIIFGSGQVLLVEELMAPDELPAWLSLPAWDDVPMIDLPDDLFSRARGPGPRVGIAGAPEPQAEAST